MYVVLNGSNRSGFREEVDYINEKLQIPTVQVARLKKHLGHIGTEPNAVAVLCDRVHATTCVLKYKENDKIKWEPGGTPRDGYYFNKSFDQAMRTNGAVSQG
ncbi:hypothetical protein CKO51_20460 [Rhodopirellula sp. SM50]|nr:hypothetical protein [Rhodopirellula sp. SM50]PAY17603.1 hypothetical protein CKO51_20460 [Rhodopirellula sp. SM50]